MNELIRQSLTNQLTADLNPDIADSPADYHLDPNHKWLRDLRYFVALSNATELEARYIADGPAASFLAWTVVVNSYDVQRIKEYAQAAGLRVLKMENTNAPVRYALRRLTPDERERVGHGRVNAHGVVWSANEHDADFIAWCQAVRSCMKDYYRQDDEVGEEVSEENLAWLDTYPLDESYSAFCSGKTAAVECDDQIDGIQASV